jgi:hypothetical protein
MKTFVGYNWHYVLHKFTLSPKKFEGHVLATYPPPPPSIFHKVSTTARNSQGYGQVLDYAIVSFFTN